MWPTLRSESRTLRQVQQIYPSRGKIKTPRRDCMTFYFESRVRFRVAGFRQIRQAYRRKTWQTHNRLTVMYMHGTALFYWLIHWGLIRAPSISSFLVTRATRRLLGLTSTAQALRPALVGLAGPVPEVHREVRAANRPRVRSVRQTPKPNSLNRTQRQCTVRSREA